jgi:hypothetical protein
VSPDPQLCGAGYFCRAGAATSTPCPERFYCPAGSNQPIVCPIGSFCSDRSGNHTVCEDGFFCPAQSSAKTSCSKFDTYCQGGKTFPVDVGNYSMPLDDYAKPRTGQQMCEPGYSCTGGVRRLCSPGKNCSQPRTGEAQPCAEGFFCNDENPSPQSCGDGYLCRTGAELPTACTPTRESAEDTYYGQFCAGGRLQTVRPGYYATPVDSSHAPLLNASSAAGEVAMVLLGGELPCGCNNGACPPASNWTTRDTVAGSNAPGLEMCCSAEAGYVCLGLGSDRGLRKAVSKGLKKVKATLNGELCGEGQEDCFAFSAETGCAKGSLCEAGEERECLDADGNPALCEEGVVKDGGCDESDQKVAPAGTCTACRPNHYALDGACASCPPREFAEACPVSGDNKTSFTLKAGFWFCTGQLSSNGTCFGETFVVNGSTQFIPCADGVSCAATRVEGLVGGLRSRWKMVCPEGTRGIGCAECSDGGYGKSVDGTCKLCPSQATMLASGAVVFTAFASFFFWFLKKSVHAPPDTEAGGGGGAAATKSGHVEEEQAHTAAMAVPRIITNHLYLTGLLKNLNVDWGGTLNSLFSFAKAASGNVPPFVDCAFGMTVFQTFRVYMMLPALAFAGPLAVLAAVVAAQKARRRFGGGGGGGGGGGKIRVLGTTVTHVFRTSVLILLYLLYPTIAQQTFQMLDCVTVMGMPYLRADVTQLCSGAEYDSNRSIALFVLATFVPAFPALIFGLMWRKRKRLSERKIQQRYLFLCAFSLCLFVCCCCAARRPPPPPRACHSLTRSPPSPPRTHTDGGFQLQYFWWEVLVMLRELACVGLFVFYGQGVDGYQVYWGLAVLLVSLLLHLQFAPFENQREQRLETMSLLTINFTLFASLGIILGGYDGGQKQTTTSAIVLINFAMIVLFAREIVRMVYAKAKDSGVVKRAAGFKATAQSVRFAMGLSRTASEDKRAKAARTSVIVAHVEEGAREHRERGWSGFGDTGAVPSMDNPLHQKAAAADKFAALGRRARQMSAENLRTRQSSDA